MKEDSSVETQAIALDQRAEVREKPKISREAVDALEAALLRQRKAIYDPLSNLDGTRFQLPQALLAVVPDAQQAKLVQIEWAENLQLTAWTPGHRSVKIGYMTLERHEALNRLVLAGLQKGGFLAPGLPIRVPPTAADGAFGHLSIQVEMPSQKPSAVTLTLNSDDLEPVDYKAFLSTSPFGLPHLFEPISASVKGVEMTRRHARKPGVLVTDNLRISLLSDLSRSEIEKWVLANGFTKANRGVNLYERETSTLALRDHPEGQMVHFQFHWTEPKP